MDCEIRKKFTGYVLTVHTQWRESYVPDGKLLVEEMGGASIGSRRIDSDRLCKKRLNVLDECSAGGRVELRHPKYPPLQGFLRRNTPANRHTLSASGLDLLFGTSPSGASGPDAVLLVSQP